MRAKLVAIGNSRCVRLPKAVIEQYSLVDEVELELRAGEIVLRPVKQVRAGWNAAFARMRARGDDGLIQLRE